MIKENKDLDAKIQKARELKRQQESIMKQIHRAAIKEIRQYMDRYEVTIEDLMESAAQKEKPAAAPTEAKKAPKKSAVKPKYRSDDGKETWSGRGLKPKWLRKELDSGRKLEEFLVKNPS
ncbi:MAG: H-NS histone family protein [Sutterellaceae bacterium]|nr:H-NS histone family protein [Sutterellaceae bacterium]MDD7442372.1 H-NS histone family protein [Sutterellaceae bacterium]MDY2867122.1 H-NS histone family protein [Mesosutterella sp.]